MLGKCLFLRLVKLVSSVGRENPNSKKMQLYDLLDLFVQILEDSNDELPYTQCDSLKSVFYSFIFMFYF